MASVSDAVWAIDLGNSSLKALQLALAGDAVQVVAFDTVRHAKILSGKGVSDLEREELIAMSLRQFVQRNNVGFEEVVISVPSQNSFARFVNLPPVEAKKIPEIVGFEAAQQIPFDMSEVQWDWQLMTDEDAAEKRVGLFAIKNEIVNAELEHFSREDLPISHVQMAPMALYNYILYDRPDLFRSEARPVVVLNIGAETTDLVVCTPSGVWQRCIMLGGNAFTNAIAEAFKINFEKAEKLKRTAAVSKYARQIFQAMRPVFTDLASEVQKSLGFYTSANPNAKISKIVALGGGTQLRGLLKYLQQTLQISVERPDMFKRLIVGPEVSAAKFHDSVVDFGVVYGLAVQVLGYGRIHSNLLPKSVARSMAWAMKIRLFMVAASMLLMVSVLALGRTIWDRVSYDQQSDVRQKVDRVIQDARQAASKLDDEQSRGSQFERDLTKIFGRFQYRDTIPDVMETVFSKLPNARNNPAQKSLYDAFEAGDVQGVKRIPRKERKQLFVTAMSVSYSSSIAKSAFGEINVDQETMGGGGFQDMAMDERTQQLIEMGLLTPDVLGTIEKPVPGFLVVVEGYSPYKDIGALLDPPGVGDQKDKWGLVTRLVHMADPNDPNSSPLVLFKKDIAEHFSIQKGPVEYRKASSASVIPVGIGVPEDDSPDAYTSTSADIRLIDPMTKEIISRVPSVDETGQTRVDRRGNPVMVTNDSWFVLKFKLQWNEAPEEGNGSSQATSPY